MTIDIHTKFITLLGSPLAQSFAARMQNAGFAAAGLNYRYFYTETDETHLGDIVNGIRYMPSLAGFAVTKPNKTAVLPYLDELDPLCAKMGACNTVIRGADGGLKGFNTDGAGFLTALTEDAGIAVAGNAFFCIGTGGAGRAICSVLAYSGAKKIYVTDIVPEAAHRLASDINESFAPVTEFVPCGDFTKIAECPVVLNASGVGMGATRGQSPLPAECLCPEQFCFDACYNPAKTRFLEEAEERGCRTLNGLGMSLYQGAAQFELWTGKKAPVEAMRRELLRILAENGKG